MGPKRFETQNFSLFLVKFKKLGFSAPLLSRCYLTWRQSCQLRGLVVRAFACEVGKLGWISVGSYQRL